MRYLSPLALLPEISSLENALIRGVGDWAENVRWLPAPFTGLVLILCVFPAIRSPLSNCR
jgi:hypothetical protein